MSAPRKSAGSAKRTNFGSVLRLIVIVVVALVVFETLMISWPLFRSVVLNIAGGWIWAALLQLLALVVLSVWDLLLYGD